MRAARIRPRPPAVIAASHASASSPAVTAAPTAAEPQSKPEPLDPVLAAVAAVAVDRLAWAARPGKLVASVGFAAVVVDRAGAAARRAALSCSIHETGSGMRAGTRYFANACASQEPGRLRTWSASAAVAVGAASASAGTPATRQRMERGERRLDVTVASSIGSWSRPPSSP
jgi:hypothetical protein